MYHGDSELLKIFSSIMQDGCHFEIYDFKGGTFVDLSWGFFCLTFVMPLCASVFVSLVVTFWKGANLLALAGDV